jgi:hypothetical protein
MKKIILLAIISFSLQGFSQELNIGGFFGAPYQKDLYDFYPLVGAEIEFQPDNSILSLTTNPYVIFPEEETIFTFPLYLKFIIGNKFRVNPGFGGFIRTNSNYGWIVGLNLEYMFNDRLIIYLKSDYYTDYYEYEYPTHFGDHKTKTDKEHSYWFSMGIKKNILKVNKQ